MFRDKDSQPDNYGDYDWEYDYNDIDEGYYVNGGDQWEYYDELDVQPGEVPDYSVHKPKPKMTPQPTRQATMKQPTQPVLPRGYFP